MSIIFIDRTTRIHQRGERGIERELWKPRVRIKYKAHCHAARSIISVDKRWRLQVASSFGRLTRRLSSPTTAPVRPATEHAIACRGKFSPRRGLGVSCSPMTSQPSTSHFCESTSACRTPRRPVRGNERIFQVTTLRSTVRDGTLVIFLVLRLRRLSERVLLLPFLANFLFVFPIFCLVHLSGYMPCVCVSPPRGHPASAAAPITSSVPNLLLYSRTFMPKLRASRSGVPKLRKTRVSLVVELKLKPITANAIRRLGHRRRPHPLRY